MDSAPDLLTGPARDRIRTCTAGRSPAAWIRSRARPVRPRTRYLPAAVSGRAYRHVPGLCPRCGRGHIRSTIVDCGRNLRRRNGRCARGPHGTRHRRTPGRQCPIPFLAGHLEPWHRTRITGGAPSHPAASPGAESSEAHKGRGPSRPWPEVLNGRILRSVDRTLHAPQARVSGAERRDRGGLDPATPQAAP
jgi:hypothetical protein